LHFIDQVRYVSLARDVAPEGRTVDLSSDCPRAVFVDVRDDDGLSACLCKSPHEGSSDASRTTRDDHDAIAYFHFSSLLEPNAVGTIVLASLSRRGDGLGPDGLVTSGQRFLVKLGKRVVSETSDSA